VTLNFGPLRPVNPIRRGNRGRWTGAIGGIQTAFSFVLRPIASPRRLTPGRAIVAQALTRIVPPIQTHGWKPLIGAVVRRNGRVLLWQGPPAGPPSPGLPPTSCVKPVASPRRLTPGRVKVAPSLTRFLPQLQAFPRPVTIGGRRPQRGATSAHAAQSLPRLLPQLQAFPRPPIIGRVVRRNGFVLLSDGPPQAVASVQLPWHPSASVLKPISSPRRLTPGRAYVAPALSRILPPIQTHGASVQRPVCSPRRLTPGRAIVPPSLTRFLPQIQAFPRPPVIGGQLRRRGSTYRPTLPSVVTFVPPPPGVPFITSGPLVPTTPVRWSPRVTWRPAAGIDAPVGWFLATIKPVCSPRRLTPGRSLQARALPRINPPIFPFTPIGGSSVFRPASLPHKLTAGRSLQASALPPQLAPLRGMTWRPTIGAVVRRKGSVYQPRGPSLGPNTPGLPAGSVLRPISSPRRLRGGQAIQARFLPRIVPPIQTHGWKPLIGSVVRRAGLSSSPPRHTLPDPPTFVHGWKPSIGRVVRRAGLIAMPRIVPQAAALIYTLPRSVHRPVCLPNPRRQGRSWVPKTPGIPTPIGRFRGGLMVRRAGDDRSRLRRGWTLHWLPIPLEGAIPAAAYHIYSNGGSGPINYNVPIATTFGLTWTSPPLAHPDTWRFGVRAFNSFGEEQNLDAAVMVVLDSSGVDITQRPAAPAGLRAFATVGGGIRVEWTYVVAGAALPIGFNVYIGTGSTPSYGSPVGNVLYSASLAGTWVANLAGLVDGTTYAIGVRAYNATAEEPNVVFVSATSDATGPSAVDSLTATAI
jgi:hypothetical protein